jgi:purine-binding chemotaxis protein CheW
MPRKPVAPTPQRQLVAFCVGDSELGVDVASVREVLRAAPVTPLPGAPEFVEGVLDLRGNLIPVIDLRRRFEVPEPSEDAQVRILVVGSLGQRLGLVVDRVTEVLPVPETSFAELPAFVRGLAAEAVESIARLPERLILVLNLERLLSTDERIALHELEAAIAEMGEGHSIPGGDPLAT